MQRIKSPCNTSLMPAYRQSGERPLSAVKLVVWHDTEGGSASGIASYFRSSASEGSAHLVVDDGACYRCLPDTAVPWGAPGANTDGFHIEQCGFASWSKARWLLHQPMLHRTAYKTAAACRRFGIPVEFVEAAGLKAGKAGITTHAQVTASGIGGAAGTHTDPGPNYPVGYVMRLTKLYAAGLRRRAKRRS